VRLYASATGELLKKNMQTVLWCSGLREHSILLVNDSSAISSLPMYKCLFCHLTHPSHRYAALKSLQYSLLQVHDKDIVTSISLYTCNLFHYLLLTIAPIPVSCHLMFYGCH